MSRKHILEFIVSILLVIIPTFFIYNHLASIHAFWSSQTFWSVVLMIGWIIVASGYVRQGIIVERNHSARNVSLFLPCAVFVIQCILFVKGIFYHDWSLITGALVVNSGVFFSMYQIIKARMR